MLHQVQPNEIWAAMAVTLPWPVPKNYLFMRGRVVDDPEAGGGGGVIAMAQSFHKGGIEPPPGVSLPNQFAPRDHLAVELAIGRLRQINVAVHHSPASSAAPAPPTIRGDVYITFDLSRMPLMTASTRCPSWLINLIVYLCVPSLWREYLEAIAALRAPSSAHARRMAADESGFYAWLEQRGGGAAARERRAARLGGRRPPGGGGGGGVGGRSDANARRRGRPWWHVSRLVSTLVADA